MPKAPKKYDPSKRPKKVYDKGWATRRRNARKKGLAIMDKKIATAKIKPADRVTESQLTAMGKVAAPPAYEPPLTCIEQFALDIMAVAKKRKDGKPRIEALLDDFQRIERRAAADVERIGLEEMHKRAMRKNDEEIVIGFLASVRDISKSYGGSLPASQTFLLSAAVIRRVYDALILAGYRAEGFRQTSESIANRRDAETELRKY